MNKALSYFEPIWFIVPESFPLSGSMRQRREAVGNLSAGAKRPRPKEGQTHENE